LCSCGLTLSKHQQPSLHFPIQISLCNLKQHKNMDSGISGLPIIGLSHLFQLAHCTMGELKEVSSPPCLSAGCPAHPWAGVQVSYFWLLSQLCPLLSPWPTVSGRGWWWWLLLLLQGLLIFLITAVLLVRTSPLQFPLPPIPKWSSLALKCLRGKEAMKPPSCEIKKEGILNRSVGIFPRFVVRFY